MKGLKGKKIIVGQRARKNLVPDNLVPRVSLPREMKKGENPGIEVVPPVPFFCWHIQDGDQSDRYLEFYFQ